jgi:hypothetical protein
VRRNGAQYCLRRVARNRGRPQRDGHHHDQQLAYLKDHFSALELTDACAVWSDNHLRAIDLAVQAYKAEIELGRLLGRSLRTPGDTTTRAP